MNSFLSDITFFLPEKRTLTFVLRKTILKNMSGYDWSRFSQRITINADKASIYKLWATQQGLEKWFLRSAVFHNTNDVKRKRPEFVHQGDQYIWMWHGYSDDVKESGSILLANGTDTLKFLFSGNSQVTIKIYLERDEMICELTQQNIPIDEKSKQNLHIGCMMGWNFYLTNLKSILEGGIDLRNKNERIVQVINA